MISASTSIPGMFFPNPYPSNLTLRLVNLVPPSMSLALCKLLTLQWSPEQVSLWVSASVLRPFKTCSISVLSSSQSHSDSNAEGFYSKYASSSCHWRPGLGSLVWDCDPFLLSGGHCIQDILPDS